jgi:hypothetical protein
MCGNDSILKILQLLSQQEVLVLDSLCKEFCSLGLAEKPVFHSKILPFDLGC